MGDERSANRLASVRPIGHRIYVPMETSLSHAKRYQTDLDDEEKRANPPPKYDATSTQPAVLNITTN